MGVPCVLGGFNKYASSIIRTLPTADARMALVLTSLWPSKSPTKSAADFTTTRTSS